MSFEQIRDGLYGTATGQILLQRFGSEWWLIHQDEPHRKLVSLSDLAAVLSSGSFTSPPLASSFPVALFSDSKASGTSGGDFNNGAWVTRDLNTEDENTITGASLGGNAFTLPSGLFLCVASAPAYAVNGHKARLFDVTGGVQASVGSAEHADSSYNVQTRSLIQCVLSPNAPTQYRVEHRCISTQLVNGRGIASGLGVSEIYTQVKVIQLG